MTTQDHREAKAMTEQTYTAEQARKALDDMDDYARMETGVDAIGPRKVLEAFIEQAEQMMRAREMGEAVTAWMLRTGHGTAFHEGARPPVEDVGWTPLYTAPRAVVPDGWKLVPWRPNEAMFHAGMEVIREGSPDSVWDLMLAAAPEVTK
jgi:hypothetical protein